jgi:peptidoglycan hydrolase-like protein with peptidoglycan-binding domain
VKHPGRIFAAVLVVAVLGAGTFLTGRWSVPLSAGQRASSSAPPVVAIPAERRYIQDRTQVTGLVRAAHTTTVTLVQPSGATRAVVTKAPPTVGATIRSGDVVLAVSGRPMIVLEGAVPAYRDIANGASGRDVTQLQNALRDLGYHPDSDGTASTATVHAVTDLYRHLGFEPPSGGIAAAAAEVMFVPGLPGTLAAAPATLGAAADGQPVTVDTGGAVVAVSASSAQAVPAGATVQLTCLDRTVRGVAGRPVPAAPASGQADSGAGGAFEVPVEIGEPVDRQLIGTTCLGTETTRKTRGKVLAVPVSAVFDASGGGSVVRIDADTGPRTIQVTTGVSGDGWIEILNPPDGLDAGTKVLVDAAN